ncbi:hypothetical protein AC230_21695 [Streptomyces caatingaensis]|uniref:Methyltransferase n=2 Tax=Streptomyces caatingaensis TaxID=1678637 RepID=A0A0K9XBG3_9ACTN|nr:hypothetical protein AC230_21695 [Streptomyces caatingaensis]
MNLLTGVERAGILRAGIELRVFDALADAPLTAAAAAAAIGSDARATEVLLEALAALALLEARVPDEPGGRTRYALTDTSRRFLVTGASRYIGGLAKVYTCDYVLDSVKDLAGAVRHGRTLLEDDAEKPGHPYWREFAEGITATSRATSRHVCALLEEWAGPRPTLDVLDVACGNGIQSLTLARRFPRARVHALDWPNVLEVTRRTAEEFGVADRVAYLPGDMFEVAPGGPYDLVLVSHVLHFFDVPTSVRLLSRLAATLRPGGRLLVNDFLVVSRDPLADPASRVFSAQMLAISKGGHTYSLEELRATLTASGLAFESLHSLPGMPVHTVLARAAADGSGR